MGKTKNKVFIIGLDGASWKVLNPIIKDGLIPNLSTLIKKGTAGILKSTIPPITAPAWTTFQTGANPGKHGLYDFLDYRPGSYEFSLHSSKSIKLKTLWEIVSDTKKTVVSINVPMTYPPKKVKGATIAGMMSPSERSNFTYPSDLYDELKNKNKDYRIFPSPQLFFSSDIEKIVNTFIDIEKKRVDAALYLMQKHDWDLFMIHNQCLDVLQHRFWPYIFKDHKQFDETKWHSISHFFNSMDDNIGQLLSKLDDNTTIMVVSDHGFCDLDKTVNISSWLNQKGFLSFKKKSLLPKVLSSAKKIDVFNIRKKFFFLSKEKVKAKVYQELLIDWSKTKAFCAQGGGLIHINCKDREPQGIVNRGKEYEEIRNKIIDKLKELKDPSTGLNIVKNVFKKEEIYHGPFTKFAPDLIALPENGYALRKTLIGNNNIFSNTRIGRDSVGTHDEDGIFIFSGKAVKKNCTSNPANLIDIAPTVLYFLDIDDPDYMDGKILKEIIEY